MLTHDRVIYDRERDVIYLANMNMKPWAKDRNRPISLAESLVIENNSLRVQEDGEGFFRIIEKVTGEEWKPDQWNQAA
jgi:hypothetical protein